MSFAADLKDFASSFRDTYKVLHESGRDELAREQAAHLRDDRGAKVRGEAAFQSGRNIGGLNTPDARSSDTGSASERKAPVFTTVKFDNTAPRLINDLVNEVGLPEHAAQGFVGRLGAETGGFSTLQETNPTVRNSRGGFGYAQWTGPRRDAFEAYAAAKGLDPASYEANKGFLVHELTNTREGRVLDALKRTRNAQEAGNVVERQFLRPGIPHGRRGVSWVDRAGKFGLGQGGSDLVEQAKRLGPLPRRAAIDTEDDETAPVVYAATGGVIPSGSDRAVDTTISENAGSNPVTRDVMDAERSEEDYDPRSLVDIEGARQAVAGGLRFGQRVLGLETHHAAVPSAVQLNPDGVTALQTNIGAPPREEVEVIHRTVDPKGELPPELRDIAGYNALQKFWTARGEPQKADAAAWNMLQASKKAVSQYGALALSIDDPVKRAQVIAKAHNEYLPDGEVMKITGKSGNGAKFELFNNKGDLTEKGVLAMDDMVKMATGMHNGTAYLQSMVKFATDAPTPAERKIEAERKSIEEFERERGVPEDERDFMNTLSDNERNKFLKMPSSAQKVYRKEHMARVEQDRKQSNFDTRLQVGAENMDRKEANDLAKTAIRLGMWEKTREQVMTQHEQKLAQLQAQEAGRNDRFDQSMAARRRREQEIDQRILNKRTATHDGAGVKLTAKEAAENRRQGAIDTTEQGALDAVDAATPLTPGGNEGTMEERRRRDVIREQGPIRVQAGYSRIPPADRAIDEAGVDKIGKKVGELMPVKPGGGVSPEDQMWVRRIATDISATGGAKVPDEEAAVLVHQALDPKSPDPVVLPGGGVRFRPNSPVMYMSGESLMHLARLRARAQSTAYRESDVQQGRRGTGRAAIAVPGATAPVPSALDDRAQRAANRRRAIDLMGTRYGIRD